MGTQPEQPAEPEAFTSFGALLRFLRVRARLSQRDLSIAIGYSEAHISRFLAFSRSKNARKYYLHTKLHITFTMWR
jgi:transcriptional regulator with XRE-family HTH domain